ncbi:ankyrin repeat-containing domain protein [Xylaria flabelliformis]|nr:ankyrin repeat-containing domain protein [Xylaria flabelliformis]
MKRTIRILSEHGACLESQTKYVLWSEGEGYSPLSRAIMQGQEEITQMLLDMNVGIAARSRNVFSPLHVAAPASNIETIQSLLNKGADIEAVDYGKLTPLIYAVRKDSPEAVRLLLERGANVEAAYGFYRATALHYATVESHTNAA